MGSYLDCTPFGDKKVFFGAILSKISGIVQEKGLFIMCGHCKQPKCLLSFLLFISAEAPQCFQQEFPRFARLDVNHITRLTSTSRRTTASSRLPLLSPCHLGQGSLLNLTLQCSPNQHLVHQQKLNCTRALPHCINS